MYCLPLAGLDDGSLFRLVGIVPPGSMLLLEDIDVIATAHDRVEADTTREGTLGGLLNALDGVATPPGLVTVMTTNKPEVLDSALVRKGRVDITEEIPFLDGDQFGRLVNMLIGRAVGIAGAGLAPVDVAEAVKANLGDTDAQVKAIADLAHR